MTTRRRYFFKTALGSNITGGSLSITSTKKDISMNGKRAKQLRKLSKENDIPYKELKKAYHYYCRIDTVNIDQYEVHRVQGKLLPRLTNKG